MRIWHFSSAPMSYLHPTRSRALGLTGEPSNERRHACRSRAVVRDVVLGCQPDDRRDDLSASLENVSIDGCLAKSRSRPKARPGDPIWFGLAGSHPSERTEGILIEARRLFFGGYSIRIRFLTPLPYAMFKHLVYGPQHSDQRPSVYRECETDKFWR
jgi:hypothetical protein